MVAKRPTVQRQSRLPRKAIGNVQLHYLQMGCFAHMIVTLISILEHVDQKTRNISIYFSMGNLSLHQQATLRHNLS